MTDFEGPEAYEAGLEYMRNKFTGLIKPDRKPQLYHHFTCMSLVTLCIAVLSQSLFLSQQVRLIPVSRYATSHPSFKHLLTRETEAMSIVFAGVNEQVGLGSGCDEDSLLN